MSTKKRNALIIFIVLLFLSVFTFSAYSIFNMIRENLEKKSMPHTVYSYDDVFEVQLPGSMDLTENKGDLNPDACLEASDSLDKYFIALFSNPKKEIEEKNLNITYQNYVDIIILNYEREFSTQIDEVKEFVTEDSRKIKYVEFDTVSESEEFHCILYFFETQNNFASMLFYSYKEDEVLLKMHSEEIVPTLKEKGQQAVAPI